MSDAGATFGVLEGRVLTLFGAGDLDGARATAELTAERFPDRRAYTAFWMACIEAVRGEPDRAARALTDAVESGDVWWGSELLLGDPDLESLRALPSFNDLVAECERRGGAARVAARVEWSVVPARGAATAPASLVALHGRTGNVADLLDRWSCGADAGVAVVVVQSSQMVAQGMYCWDDLAVAEADIAIAVNEAAGSGDVVLAGFSQGAGIAARMALRLHLERVRGFVSIAPSFSRPGLTLDDLGPLLSEAARAGVRGWMALGERDDRYRPSAEELGRALDAAGVPARWAIVDGIGHEYPEPWPEVLAGALAYVLHE